MSQNKPTKEAGGSFGGNFFKDFYFSQGDYRSQEKVTKDEGAKQDLMEKDDDDQEKVELVEAKNSNHGDVEVKAKTG